MSKKILFSPVGGTDPISMNNYKDGALLHICRVYKPDVVYMYMSKEIMDNENKDHRYTYCLNMLQELLSFKMDYHIIEKESLSNVQDFNYFYEDFRKELMKIMGMMDESDELLLNISSGTPAMKSGLLVLKTIGEIPCKTIQTVTPAKKMNEHNHEGYDVTLLWEMCEDNSDNFENRCSEVSCPELSNIKNEEMIKKYILSYDYQAALALAQAMPKVTTDGYINYIELASRRLLLDFPKIKILLQKTKMECFPISELESKKCFEYALNLEIKLKKCEYADFVRAITPLILDLFIMITDKVLVSKKVRDFCDNKNDVLVWNKLKLESCDEGLMMIKIWNKQFNGNFDYSIVKSIHLKEIIENNSNDINLHELIDDVRSVESKVRNLAAHNIVSISNDYIKCVTGKTAEEIMRDIKKLFTYTKINILKEYWNSYDDMNKLIIEKIDKK